MVDWCKSKYSNHSATLITIKHWASGSVTGEEFEHEDSEGPVVSADVVTLVQDDLGGNVLGGAAEGPSLSANLKFEYIVSTILMKAPSKPFSMSL